MGHCSQRIIFHNSHHFCMFVLTESYRLILRLCFLLVVPYLSIGGLKCCLIGLLIINYFPSISFCNHLLKILHKIVILLKGNLGGLRVVRLSIALYGEKRQLRRGILILLPTPGWQPLSTIARYDCVPFPESCLVCYGPRMNVFSLSKYKLLFCP